MRNNSIAFLGPRSIESLEKISLKSASMGEFGQEKGFFTTIDNSKEIIFKEFQYDAGTAQLYPMDEAIKDFKSRGGNPYDLLGIGHTHVDEWKKARHSNEKAYSARSIAESFEFYLPPSKPESSIYSGGVSLNMWDFKDRLERKTPMFIGSPVGLTIYAPVSKENYRSNGNLPTRAYLYSQFKR